MKDKMNTTIRVFGQRSIAPSFFNRSSDSGEGSDGVLEKKKTNKVPGVSLSAFLDMRLNKTPVLYKPKTGQERSRSPFTSFIGSKDDSKSSKGTSKIRSREEDKTGVYNKWMFQQFKPGDSKPQCEEENNSDLDKIVLQQFKEANAEQIDDLGPCSTDREQVSGGEDDQGSRKRKDPFEGVDFKGKTWKPVLVLSDNLTEPKPKRTKRVQTCNISNSNNKKKQRPAYNHYANGSGWWDNNMEGIDSEEVGYGEVWEGVGSTTFGETIDWH